MQVFAGTSGFSFDEWKGHFYPHHLRQDSRLAYYAAYLPSVEINNTFYRMPQKAALERWRESVPDSFRFAVKAPRRLTHAQALRVEEVSLATFLDAMTWLGPRLGPVLFQLPPTLHKDTPLLSEFIGRLPSRISAAFEFRHRSWFADDVFEVLALNHAALCGGDAETPTQSPPLLVTAGFGYVRLRAPSYDPATLRAWAERVLAQPWSQAFVYLSHEARSPYYAHFFMDVCSGAPVPQLQDRTWPM